jgi:hypothetical protein
MKDWLVIALLGIVCGSAPAVTAQEIKPTQIPLPLKPPENEAFGKLIGNWKLGGDRDRGIFPTQSVNIAVAGDQILAAAHYEIVCSDQIDRHFRSDLMLVGKLASDRSFTLSSGGSLGSDGRFFPASSSDQVAVVINGAVPAGDAKTWKGNYKFTIPPYKELSSNPYGTCNSPQTGNFVASAFAPLSGTYTGAISGEGFGSGVSVTLTVSQNGPQTASGPDGQPRLMLQLFPLSASISVRGSSCFAHGTSRTPADGNQLSGNRFDLNFDMDGVAVLIVDGWVAGPDSDTLREVHFQVGGMGSKCFNASGTGTLTKQ